MTANPDIETQSSKHEEGGPNHDLKVNKGWTWQVPANVLTKVLRKEWRD